MDSIGSTRQQADAEKLSRLSDGQLTALLDLQTSSGQRAMVQAEIARRRKLPPAPEPEAEPQPTLRAVREQQGIDVDAQLEAARNIEPRPDLEPETEGGWPPWWADMTGSFDPAPTLMATGCGQPVLIEGRHHILFGPKATGKSTFALLACEAAVEADGAALYLSWEMPPQGVAQRFDEMGRTGLRDFDAFRLVYVPNAFRGDDTDRPRDIERARQWVHAHLSAGRPVIVVFDSVARAGGATNSDEAYVEWLNNNVRPWERIGATVLLVDHVIKRKMSDEDLFYGPRGTGAKIDQADIALNAVGTAWSTANRGEISLVVRKDRYSELNTPEGRAAAVIEGTPKGNRLIDIQLRAANEADHQRAKQATPENLHDTIENWFRNNPKPITASALAREIRKAKDRTLTAVKAMKANGTLTETDQGVCLSDQF